MKEKYVDVNESANSMILISFNAMCDENNNSFYLIEVYWKNIVPCRFSLYRHDRLILILYLF